MPQSNLSSARTAPHSTCYLCGASGNVLYPDVRDRLFGVSGSWAIKECANSSCGLLWLDPRPLPESIPGFYESYYTHEDTAPPATGIRRLRSLAGKFFNLLVRYSGIEQMRAELLSMGLADVQPGRLLEIGCGNGSRLGRLARRGWIVEGQEVDKKAASAARAEGLAVHEGMLEELHLPPRTYDAVIANHVIEHVFDPVSLVRECHRILKPGGRIVLVAPNADSLGHARFRECWVGLDVPRHLWVFRLSSLKALLTSAQFQSIEARSTPANADFFYALSEEIRLRGFADMRQTRTVRATFIGKAGQLTGLRRWRRDPGCGEECVVSATRA